MTILPKTAVIGAGLGGIATALRLRKRGYQVDIYDRLPVAGGRARTFTHDGFTFDAGPTVITAPFLLHELFELFGKSSHDYFELIALDTWYEFLYPDGSKLSLKNDLAATISSIAEVNPIDAVGYQDFLKFCTKILRRGFDDLATVAFDNPLTLLSALPDFIRLKSYRSVYSLIRSFISDEMIAMALSISPLLVGGNPLTTTSIYCLINALEREYGVWFAKGGTAAIVKGLCRLMHEEGVNLQLNSDVSQITTSENKVTGLMINGTQMQYDLIIANSDPQYTYEKLLSRPAIRPIKHSMGLFVLYFATKKRYENIAHHSVIFGSNDETGYRKSLHQIFNGKTLPTNLNCYLHRPSASDPEITNSEHDIFYVLTPVPNLKLFDNWQEEAALLEDRVITMLENRVMPNLRENIVSKFHITPEYFSDELLTPYGSGFSLQPLFYQSAYFRHHNRSKIKNLYFVGAGTHPGAGVPGVLSSAKLVDGLIA